MIAWIVLGTLITLYFSVSTPLFTYSTTLALFGLPHVLSEMGYVADRFKERWSWMWIRWIFCLLGGIVLSRVCLLFHWIDASTELDWELGLGCLLIASVLPLIYKEQRRSFFLLSLSVIILILGVIYKPLWTILLISIAHNFTPLGFIFENKSLPKHSSIKKGSLLLFIGVPLLIASGLPFKLFYACNAFFPDWNILGLKYLDDHLSVYIHPSWKNSSFALHLFSAFVFAQCMHYASVLHLLPRFQSNLQDPVRLRRWHLFLGGVGLMTFSFFRFDFLESRQVYGLFASIHAWLELPLLFAVFLSTSSSPLPQNSTECTL